MATALIHIDPKQKARLARRAKKHGRSFWQEEELTALAREAKAVADRSIKPLDETIAYVSRGLQAIRKSQ